MASLARILPLCFREGDALNQGLRIAMGREKQYMYGRRQRWPRRLADYLGGKQKSIEVGVRVNFGYM